MPVRRWTDRQVSTFIGRAFFHASGPHSTAGILPARAGTKPTLTHSARRQDARSSSRAPFTAAVAIAFLSATLSAPAQSTSSGILAPGAKLEKLAGGFEFTEGATCDAAGNVFFTDQPSNRILKWSVDGKLSTFKQPAGRANGMCFDANGNLLACADEKNELWSIATNGNVTVLLNQYHGKLLNGPNDVSPQPDGSLYFTDPYYQRKWWSHTSPPQGTQQVYYLSADRKTLKRVTDDLIQPNGIVSTPDGKTLFVADLGARKTYCYEIEPDGSLTNKTFRAPMGSDGMTLDMDGNLYLTGGGVFVFDPHGKQIEHIAVPEPWVGNICFGGKDRQTLFIAASKGFYSIHTKTKGANPAK